MSDEIISIITPDNRRRSNATSLGHFMTPLTCQALAYSEITSSRAGAADASMRVLPNIAATASMPAMGVKAAALTAIYKIARYEEVIITTK